MKIYNMLMNAAVVSAVFALSTLRPVYAATESLQLDAHEHGKGLLMLVLDGNEMQLAFQSAAQNVVGFEQKATSAEQRAEITAVIEVFNRAEWFQFNADANCDLITAESSTDLQDVKFHRGHADFYANYQLLCQQPTRLKQLELSLFNLLPSLQQLQVQWSINGQQGATDTSLGNATVHF